jgi:hypothetical protein
MLVLRHRLEGLELKKDMQTIEIPSFSIPPELIMLQCNKTVFSCSSQQMQDHDLDKSTTD